jgi:hypothetical protein
LLSLSIHFENCDDMLAVMKVRRTANPAKNNGICDAIPRLAGSQSETTKSAPFGGIVAVVRMEPKTNQMSPPPSVLETLQLQFDDISGRECHGQVSELQNFRYGS